MTCVLHFSDLLEIVPNLFDHVRGSVTCKFIHKTIQEFLVAYHITLLPPDSQSEFLSQHLDKNDYMAMVARFIAGLTNFNQITDNLEDLFITGGSESLMQLIHCLFETQDSKRIAKVLKSKQILDFSFYSLSTHDCYALNYCIVKSRVSIDLRLESCNLSDDALTTLLQPMDGKYNAFYYVEKLVLTKNPVVKTRFSEICKLF